MTWNLMLEAGEGIAHVLEKVTGAADVGSNKSQVCRSLTLRLDRGAMARYGLNVAEVQEVVEIALGGKNAGQVFEGDRRFDSVVRLPEAVRVELNASNASPSPARNRAGTTRVVPTPQPTSYPWARSPSSSSPRSQTRSAARMEAPGGGDRECARPRPRLLCGEARKDPRGGDIPAGHRTIGAVSFSSSFRLRAPLIVVPIALLLIFLLFFVTFGNLKDGLLVFTGVPFA